MMAGMGTQRSLGSGFQALLGGSLVSNLGDGIRLAALPLLADSLTSSPFLVASVTAAQYLPWLVFAPAGGALVDRWNRRRTILVTQVWRGIVMGGLGALVWSSMVEIWVLCVVAFAITVGEILVDPSTVALVPTLVDDDQLDRANGRMSSVEIVTNDFAGGPVGTALFGFAPWLPFLFDGATYLGSVVLFGKLPRSASPAERRDGPARSLKREAGEGFRWLRRHRVLGPLTLGQIVYFFGVATSLSLLVVLVKGELDGSNSAFGIILAVAAAGAVLGTFAGPPLATRLGPRATLSGSVAAQALTLCLASAAPTLLALGALWFLNGIPAGTARPVSRSLQQRLTPNEMLGRVNVTTRIFTRGVIVFGALFAGVLATVGGVRVSFAFAGGTQFAAAAMMWAALGRLSLPKN